MITEKGIEIIGKPVYRKDRSYHVRVKGFLGNTAADFFIREEADGKRLKVTSFYSREGTQALGHSAIRDIVQQLKDEFPKAETITGFRISGIRESIWSMR